MKENTMAGNRQLFDVPLEVVSGSRFQPTGFPDIGAATFKRPIRDGSTVRWVVALLVESAQSTANHLESVGWDAALEEPVAELMALPYVRVLDKEGTYLTSSRTEAHRLASAFVKDSTLDGQDMKTVIRDRLGLRDDVPLAPREIARAVMALDPLCLLHGVFFAESARVWPGQPRIARAITGFVEATEVERADSGGVKRDHVRHEISEGAGGSSEGYGMIPFHRTEWTAAEITAFFTIDLGQITSYGLGDPASELLTTIVRWEIRSLLDVGLRLRTACDLAPISPVIADRQGEELPSASALAQRIEELVPACSDLLGDGAIEVIWNGGAKKGAKKQPAES
jgi:CRISPR-associated protein Csb1